MDRLFVRSARLVSDVLPLSAGRVVVRADRRSAARRPRRQGCRRRCARTRIRAAAAGWVAERLTQRQSGGQYGSAEMNTLIIFALLLALMLTGMPISISLGLTVLTFLFTLTDVPIESVALKLFTGIEKFEIMAIPFFILAGNFLTHGGVTRRRFNFARAMVG